MANRTDKFRYDVAVSYAGEDRAIVERIVKNLRSRGLQVFYDCNSAAYLWGKGQAEFERIYSRDSRYVLPVVSANYVRKDWCRLEFQVARAESRRRTQEFILPVRLDDTLLLGLREDTIYMDLKKTTPAQLAQAVADKCCLFAQGSPPVAPSPEPRPRARVFSYSEREVLGIVAFSSLPLPEASYQALFGRYPWHRSIARLREQKMIRDRLGGLHVPDHITAELRKDPADKKHFAKLWTEALEPHKDQPDAALMFAISCVHLGRFDDAVLALADMVDGRGLGWLNRSYLTVCTKLAEPRLTKRLRTESRVRLLNAIAFFLGAEGKHEEALSWMTRLRQYSKRVRNNWGIGQAYLNAGVENAAMGRMAGAERMYRRAIAHARRTGDSLILGRSLSNLGQTLDDVREARNALESSIAHKAAAQDYEGLVVSYNGLGNLSAQHGDPAQARRWFAKGMSLSSRWSLPHARALLLHNIGNTWHDEKQYPKAILNYRRAHRIAGKERYPDIAILALAGLGRTFFEMGQFRQAEGYYRRLRSIHAHDGETHDSLVALHDVGACLLRQRKMAEAHRVLTTAARLADTLHDEEWLAQCLIDRAWALRPTNKALTTQILKREAERQEGMSHPWVAAQLWNAHAGVLGRSNLGAVDDSLLRALNCLRRCPRSESDRVAIYSHLYCTRWTAGNHSGAFAALNSMIRIARTAGLSEEEARATDQMGVNFQELGRMGEAEQAHRRALQIARRLKDAAQICGSLNNLGELMRKTERFGQAITTLRQSERIAERLGDWRSAIASACNRALAMEAAGDRKGAVALVRKCRSRAARLHLWHESILATEALGSMFWYAGRKRQARQIYAQALRSANKHHDADLRPEIALNLARIMRETGHARAALNLLRPYHRLATTCSIQYSLSTTLAELYGEMSRPKSAILMWESARRAAETLNDRDGIATTSAAMSELLEQQDSLNLSDAELRRAIRHEEDPTARAHLLVQRFGLLLKAKKGKAVQAAFDEAQRLTQQLKLHELHIDLLMRLGDHNWNGKYAEMVNAMQAYTAASIEGVLLNHEIYGKIVAHIIDRVFAARNRLTSNQFDMMAQRVNEWLAKQGAVNPQVLRLCTSPIRVGHKFSALAEDKATRGLTKKAITRIVAAEIAAASA